MDLAKRIEERWGRKAKQKGFALPTVLIVSIILLAIGVSTLQIGAAISRSLTDQHWDRLAKVTAQSGVAFASSCVGQGIETWPSALTPNMTCTGAAVSPARDIYVSSDTSATTSPSRWRSTYTINPPTIGSDYTARVKVVGKVEILTSNDNVIKTYTHDYDSVLAQSQRALKIAHSDYVGCAITTAQQAFCTGDNQYGSLGDGTSGNNRLTPVAFAIPGGKAVTDITTSIQRYTCALTAEQEVYCAGKNDHGQLGIIPYAPFQATPSLFQIGGKKSSLVITTKVGIDTNSSSLGYNTCALTTDQLLYCAGSNGYGQIGDGITSTVDRTTPALFALPGKKIQSVGQQLYFNTCVVTTDQLGYCSGRNDVGQLAQAGNTVNRYDPVLFTPPTGAVVSMAVGAYNICALTTNQKVYCSGDNLNGQLGNGVFTPTNTTPVEFNIGTKKAAAVVAGIHHTCVLTTDELVYCAGYNFYGQLGDGTKPNDQATPRLFNLYGKKAQAISTIAWHTCALTTDQLVYCAGKNDLLSLGNGNNIDQASPVLFQLGSQKALSIDTAVQRTCAITTRQRIYCTGSNSLGQLGNNSTTDSSVPTQFFLP